MYLCRCTDSETALRIVSALRWRKIRKSQSLERVSNSRSSCAPSSAVLDFSFWYRSFLASQFCTTYGEICSTEKRVRLFMYNVGNVQTIDTERTCLTSQIFVVVDFAKHRLGNRRLHLRHCGSIRQNSHGSIVTPSTPQFEHVILARCMSDDISEIIEQKWWRRVKLTSGIWLVLSQHHYFRVRNGNTNFVKIYTSIQTKKQVSPLLCDARKSLCGGIVDELFSETHKLYWITEWK